MSTGSKNGNATRKANSISPPGCSNSILVSGTRIDRHYFNDSVVRFFEPENEADLADKMLTLIRDEQERQRLIANATRFLQDYTWENKKHLYLDLLDRLAGRNNTLMR